MERAPSGWFLSVSFGSSVCAHVHRQPSSGPDSRPFSQAGEVNPQRSPSTDSYRGHTWFWGVPVCGEGTTEGQVGRGDLPRKGLAAGGQGGAQVRWGHVPGQPANLHEQRLRAGWGDHQWLGARRGFRGLGACGAGAWGRACCPSPGHEQHPRGLCVPRRE